MASRPSPDDQDGFELPNLRELALAEDALRAFRLQLSATTARSMAIDPTEAQLSSKFVPGPIPLIALYRLRRCHSAKPLVVYLLARAETRKTARLRGEGAWVTLPRETLRALGISPRGKYRAVVSLKKAGLIEVTRSPGHAIRVRVLPLPSERFHLPARH